MSLEINRRLLLQYGVAQLGVMALSSLVPVRLFAQAAAIDAPTNTFVFIFLRGAMDGLSALAPVNDENYLIARPNVKLTAADAKTPLIDSQFALHPKFQNLARFWNDGQLAVVTGCGSPDPTRSHFDAQDYVEFGAPGDKTVHVGLFNRLMQEAVKDNRTSWSALALQGSLPRSLAGPVQALAVNELKDLKTPTSQLGNSSSLESLYAQATDRVFRGVGNDMFKNLGDSQKKLATVTQVPFPDTKIGKHLRDISAAIKSKLGVRVAVTEMEGWDNHVNQGTLDGQLSKRIEELDSALGAFVSDLGPEFKNVTLVMMSEFGRTVKENGNKGTDHGHGSLAWILGGEVKGKRRLGNWVPLKAENLYEGRDVPVSTDHRDVFAEVFAHHFGVKDWTKVFPKYQPKMSLKIYG